MMEREGQWLVYLERAREHLWHVTDAHEGAPPGQETTRRIPFDCVTANVLFDTPVGRVGNIARLAVDDLRG